MPTIAELRELIPDKVNDATLVSMAKQAGLITTEEWWQMTSTIPLE